MATTLTSEVMSLPVEPLKRKSPTSIDASETMKYHSQTQNQQQEERDSLHQLNNNHQSFKHHYRRLFPNFPRSGSANDYNGNKRPLSDDYDNLKTTMPRLSLVLEERPSELDLRSESEAGDDIVDNNNDLHSSFSKSSHAALDLIVSCDDNANDIKRSLNGDFVTAHEDDSSTSDVSASTKDVCSSLREADAVRVSEPRGDKRPDSLSTQPATTACAGSDGEVHVPSFSQSKELSFAPEISSGNFGRQTPASVNGQSIGDGVTGSIQTVGKPVFAKACDSSEVEVTLIQKSGLSPTSYLESSRDRLVSKELCCAQSYNESSHGDDDKLDTVHAGQCDGVYSETPVTVTLCHGDELKSDTSTDKLPIDKNSGDRVCVDYSPVEHCEDSRISPNIQQAYPEDMGLSSSRQSKARGDADKGTALKEISRPIVKNGVKKESQKEGGNVKGDNLKKKSSSLQSSSRENKPSNGHPPHVISTPSCASLQLGVKNTHNGEGQGSGDKRLATSRGQGGTEDESEKPLLGSTSHITRGRRPANRRTIPSASEAENGISRSDSSKGCNIPICEDNTETVTIASTGGNGATRGSIHSSPGYADITSLKDLSPHESKNEGKTGGKKQPHVNELVVIYSKPIPRQHRNNGNAVKYVDSARAIQANSNKSQPSSSKHEVNGVFPNSVASTTVSASLPPLPPPLYSSLHTATTTAQSHSSISSSVFKDTRCKSTSNPQTKGERSTTPTNKRAQPSEELSDVVGDYDNPVERSQESEGGPRSIDDLQAALLAEHSIRRYPYSDQEQHPGVSVSSSEAGDPFSPIDGSNDSKRNSTSSSLFSSVPGDSPDSISTDSQFHPAREYPYSSDNDTEVRSSDGRYRPSSRVQVTCQIKKSSTSDALDSIGRGSNFSRFARASSASYDYFSLDRRSRLRSKSIQDSHVRTVSMDQLLKIRKQSCGSIVSRPDSTPLENLSVDDILQSCSEYEEDEVLNRHRHSSQISRKSSMSQMSFLEAINTPLSPNDDAETGHRASHTSLVAQVNPKTKTQMKNDAATDLKIDQGQSNKPVCPQQMRSVDNKTGSSKSPSPVTKTAPSTGPPPRVFSVSGIRVVPLDPSAKTKADMMKSRSFDSNHWPPVTVTDNAFPPRAEVFFPHSLSQPSLKGASPTTAFKTPPSSHNQGPCSPGLKHFNYSPKGELSSSVWHNNNPRLDTIVSVEEDESIIKEGATTPTPTSTSPSLTSNSPYHSDEIARNIPSKPHLNGSCMIGNRNNNNNDFKDNTALTSSLQPSNMVLSSDAITDNHDVTDGQCLGVPRQNVPFVSQAISSQSSTESNTGNNNITPATSIISSTISSVISPPPSSSTTLSFSMPTSTSVSSISSTVTSVSVDTSGSRPIVSLPLLVSGPSMTTLTVDTLSSPTDTSLSQASTPMLRSPNTIAKLEAVEAIQWLRAAGFPQYAQMFEDGQFPIELALVEKDHDFLDKDSIQSLFRRLETLNKYAGMKLDAHQRKKAASEEEEDDDICALSERWQYQKSDRRWSRKDLGLSSKSAESGDSGDLTRGGSHDSLLADQDSGSQTGDSPLLDSKMPHQDTQVLDGPNQKSATLITPGVPVMQTGNNPISPKLRRVASERLKTARILWKKWEGGLRSKKSRRHPNQKNILEISGPVVADQENMQAKLERLNCVDISPTSSGPGGGTPRGSESGAPNAPVFPSPASQSPISPHTPNTPSSALQPQSSALTGHETQKMVVGPSSPTPTSPLLATAAFRSRHSHGSQSLRVKPTYAKDDSSDTSSHANASATSSNMDSTTLREYYNAQSQLLQTLESSGPGRKISGNDPGLVEIFVLPQDHQPGMFPRVLQNGYIEADLSGTALNPRTGSVRLGRDMSKSSDQPLANVTSSGSAGHSKRLGNRVSMYDNFAPATDIEKGPNGANKPTSVLAGVDEDASSTTTTTLASTGSVYQSQESKDRSVSFDSACSGQEQEDFSRRLSYRELRDKILSEASTPSLTLRSKQESIDSAQNEQTKDAQPISPSSRGVKQSVSVDSYLKDTGSDVTSSHSRKSSSGSSNSSHGNKHTNASLSEQFSEFDVILQQLFDNISDLTRCMGRDETEPGVQYTPQSSSQEVRLTDVTVSSVTTTSSLSSSSSATAPSLSSPSLTVTTTSVSSTSSTAISSITSSKGSTQTHHKALPGLVIPTSSASSEKSVVLDQSQTPDQDILASPNSDSVFSLASPLSPTSVDKSLDHDHENSSSGGGDSHTGESISDQEGGLGDFSHDDSLEQIPAVARERRDSGVGHSLTRAPSDRRRKKIRWHSFQKCHRPDIGTRNMQINSLTVSQMMWLHKLSMLKLTGMMERFLPANKSGGWNWVLPKFMKKHKTPDFSDKKVFGVPLSVMVQRTGQPLPQCVLYAMRYLRRTSQNAVGIFRRSGVKSKIQHLIDRLEANPDFTDFEDMNAYNVADMLKTFFRELPECLLTNKLSETFRSIYTYVPPELRLEAMQAATLILPDENREVLQSLLLFLSDISIHEADHQMNAVNLAVCFTPTVFMLGARQNTLSHSPKRHRKNAQGLPGVPDPREIMEQKTSQDCLLLMITECKTLFTVPPKLFRKVQTQSLINMEPPQMFDLCGEDANVNVEVRAFGQERVQMVLKEAHDKNRGWISPMNISHIDVSHRKSMDDYPLREWKLVVDIDAPPVEVLRRIMHERHTWDEDLLSWSVVERINPHADIFQFVLNSMAPHPCRHFCVLRYWRSDLQKGACALVTMSVEHTDAMEVQGVRAIDLGSFFLMEPCGSGRSRLTYIIRVDTRGRRPEWYTNVFGHISANFLERLRDSFKQDTSGPETKV